MKFKHFAEVFIIGYLGKPNVVVKGANRFVFCGLSTSIREKLDDAAYQAIAPIDRFLMEYLGMMKNRIIIRVETWHNLAARSKLAANSIELFKSNPRTVFVRGKLTSRSYQRDGKTRTTCEVQVYDPILPAPGVPWNSLLDIQGRLVSEPTLEFISYTDDPKDAKPETTIKLLVERSYRSNKEKTGWAKDVQRFNIICFGETWFDVARELKVGQTVRMLTTLGYNTDEETLVETPLLSGLKLIAEKDLYAIEKGQPLPEDWTRLLKVS